jgi:hypothetical protein
LLMPGWGWSMVVACAGVCGAEASWAVRLVRLGDVGGAGGRGLALRFVGVGAGRG